jgi:bacteriorhodopsin
LTPDPSDAILCISCAKGPERGEQVHSGTTVGAAAGHHFHKELAMSEFLTDGQYTTVYNLLSFGLASMLFTSIFMILVRDRVLPRYRLALITSTMVTGIAAYHYYRILNSFTEAFGEGGDPSMYNVGYRYVDWLLTVPLILVETVAVLALPAAARKGLLIRLVPASILMIALGYPGDASTSSTCCS